MSQPTSIEWCVDPRTGERGHSWNVVRGCSPVSEGCEHCFARRIAARFSQEGDPFPSEDQSTILQLPFYGFAVQTASGPEWTGRVELIESKLLEPLRRRKPTLYFCNSMSDLFHEKLSFEDILRVYRVIQACPQHLFLILTKRVKRMYDFTRWLAGADDISIAEWPRQCWLGVSVENDKHLDRLDWLLKIPAALRFVSLEPMLSEIDLMYPKSLYPGGPPMCCNDYDCGCEGRPIDPPLIYGLKLVIVGGETGPGARPMELDWVRRVRDDCEQSGTPFFFKQWGEWAPDGFEFANRPRAKAQDGMVRVGRKAAGRLLDGRTWNQMPEVG